MRRFLFVLALLVLVTALSVPIAAQTGTTPQRTLQLIDSEPQEGAELGLNDPVTFFFDRNVDCASAPVSFSIDPDVNGGVRCEGASVIFEPSAAFERGVSYTFTLADTLRASDGAALAEPISITLNTLGFLTVTTTLPSADSAEVQADSTITVVFNRPVVSLTTLDEQAGLPNPLTFSPALDGSGQWVGTSIYEFTPAPALAGSTEYQVTVDGALAAIDGATQQSPYTFTFTTAAPAVVDVRPVDDPNSGRSRLDAPIEIRFNQAPDRAAFESAFTVSLAGGNSVTLDGEFEWADDGKGVRYEHPERWSLDTQYVFGFADATVTDITGAAFFPALQSNFFTVGGPVITSTYPMDGMVGAELYGFEVFFQTPMNPETLNDKVIITPTPEKPPEFFYSEWANSLNTSVILFPSTEYTVTIAPGMEDIYGNRIENSITFRFTTQAYPSDVSLLKPNNEIGFFDSNRTPTEIFATYRNVSVIDFSLYSLGTDEFARLLNNTDRYILLGSYTPSTLLKSWQIESEAPLNQMRYERLNLSDFSESAGVMPGLPPGFSCPGALPPRAKVGDLARVITEPDPLRARSEPVSGEIVELLYRGYAFSIVNGPVCNGGVVWWEITLREDRSAWVAEGVGDEYFFEVTNPAQQTQITLPPELLEGDSLPNGIYLLTANAPELAETSRGDRQFMVVGNAVLTMKTSIDSVLVWATDVRTGQSLANVPVSLYSAQTGSVGPALTDADGLVRFELPRLPDTATPIVAMLDDGTYYGMGFALWGDGIEPYQFDLLYDYYPRPYEFYMYTDRTVYRPGQTVYFRAVIRERDDVNYSLIENENVQVSIYNSEGVTIYQQMLPLTDYGTLSGQFQLADGAGVGYYRIEINLDPTQQDNTGYLTGSTAFDVAEYRLPEFQVNVTPESTSYINGDTAVYEVDTRYFFGGAVADAVVNYTVYSNNFFFNYEGEGRYDFYDATVFDDDFWFYSFNPFYGDLVTEGTGRTDAEGKLRIEVPAVLTGDLSQYFNLEATVLDSSGQTVSGRGSAIVHQSRVYVGVGPESYVSSAGDETTFNIIAVDWDQQTVEGQTVEVEIVERRWSSVQRLDVASGLIQYDSEVEEIPVTTGSATTDANGRATFAFTPPNGGIFLARVRAVDGDGNTAVSSSSLWVTDSQYVSWRAENSRRIELIADRNAYKIGDTAQILIPSPFTGSAEALVTVERGDVLFAERITLESNSSVYELPITEDLAPNAYVTVMIVKGVDENNPVADFRFGVVEIDVERIRKEIVLEITPDREFAGPGENVKFTLRATDYAGNPVQAELGVSLVDLAALSIGEPYTGPIVDAFYRAQALGVTTSTALTINTDYLTQYTIDVIKGGGGGGGGGGIYEIREEFIDTPYWNGALVTDASGLAEFEVTLPDNLTTWRLDVRGVTDGSSGTMLVGEETFDFLSTKPVLVRPVTPRFFVVDDEVVLGAVVNNNTDEAVTATVSIEATGLDVSDELSQVVEIAANSSARVSWNVRVNDVESVGLVFIADANDGEYTDAVRPVVGIGPDRVLPVYKYEAPETVGTGGVLSDADSRTESIVLPRRFTVTQGELTLSLEPSLAAAALKGLDVLENTRCDCISLTASKLWTNAITRRAIDQLALDNPLLATELDSEVNLALQRLAATQMADGGWGWFPNDRSDALVTANVVLGMLEAAEAGYSVDSDILVNGIYYLQSNLESQFVGLDSLFTWQLNRLSYIVYTLSRAGLPDAARISNLFEERERLSLYAKALLWMSLSADDSARLTTLRDDLLNAAIISANGAHWEESEDDRFNWGSDTRTTAIVLRALLQRDPENALAANVVRWLMVSRRADAWETSEETAWAVLSLTDWMVKTSELQANYDYSAQLNGESLIENSATPANVTETQKLIVEVSDLLADQANTLVVTRGEGTGTLYYTAYLRAFLPVPEIPAVDRGIVVERRYTVDGETVTSAQIGDLVEVTLTVIAPNDLNYLYIEDPLPAGAEGVDPSLSTSQQTGTDPFTETVDEDGNLSRGWGWWYFSNTQFLDESVVLSTPYLPAGTYQFKYYMRPSVAGTFNVIPPTAREFYFPEVFGRGEGSTFTITEAGE